MAGKQTPPAAGVDKAKPAYRALSPLRANKRDFDTGDTVTGLNETQAAELLALGVIEATAGKQED